MRRFLLGALVGGGIMYWYLYHGGEWFDWSQNRAETIGSQYRGDATKRRADEVLR